MSSGAMYLPRTGATSNAKPSRIKAIPSRLVDIIHYYI